MSRDEFIQNMGRLAATFGKTHYSPERLEVMWEQVKPMSGFWFKRCVDSKIATMRQAPLPADFLEDISQERERQYQAEKKQQAQDAKDFWSGRYHSDEIKSIVATIKRRMFGEMSDEDWDKFIKLLEETAKLTTPPGQRRGA